MNWTRETPTTEGWYWFKLPGLMTSRIVQVEKIEGCLNAGNDLLHMLPLEEHDPDCEWAGPIPEPGESGPHPLMNCQACGQLQEHGHDERCPKQPPCPDGGF